MQVRLDTADEHPPARWETSIYLNHTVVCMVNAIAMPRCQAYGIAVYRGASCTEGIP
ncbi:hypothetical protein [Nodularia sp. NIES-3585]|uniref:hypothetical protein n=1 Tax=Nodularia sp. NIES-3585 TaxID=1973477 RepID=UPI000B692A38|nr:hypothetical protein [Nodularia sp. NIES-3585]GAX36687.1 hypothetical protein NIES3585_27240 [Nodularia sp. NIES-3585]